ncbi:hypothetical protein ABBQ38_012601 [Trebouxia sp. C0009 RCD-2024]
MNTPLSKSSNPEPFKAVFSKTDVEDLKERLSRSRWPDQLPGVGWEYGANLQYVQELAEHWETKFDWQKAEAYINSFRQYKLTVNGIELHFVHERSDDPDAIPLIFSHGWPGSFMEAFKIIPRLTAGKPQAFHVVVPSLPGFGFSSAPKTVGFGAAEIAKTYNGLMQALGYTSYVAQGGDYGSAVTCCLGSGFPKHCKAIHLNFVDVAIGFGRPRMSNPWHVAMLLNAKLPFLDGVPLFISREEIEYLKQNERFVKYEAGYAQLQFTKPTTVGYGLNDSPVGLLAYIVEKFRSWSDCRGDLESRFSKDDVLMDISLYWFNKNITSSFRVYYESMGPHAKDKHLTSGKRVEVPTAVANFRNELFKVPQSWAASSFNLKRWSKFPTGGHFAALEEPELLANDMIQFFAQYQ